MNQKSKKKAIESASHLAHNDLYQVLFEQATEGIFIADERGYYIDVNQHGCEMLGYARDEMLNLAMKDLIPNEDLEHDPLQFDKLQVGKSLLKERRLRCKDGGLISVEISAQMLTDGNYLGIVRDISKRKQAEEELQRREHEFRTLTEHFPDTIARFDREGRYLYVNSSVEKVSGIPVQELIGQRYGEKLAERLDSVVSEETISLRQAIQQVFVTGDTFETEIKVTLSTGEYFRNVRLFPEFNQAEQVASVLYISRDITEQKQAEEALRASERRLQLALEAGQMGEWEWDIVTDEVIWSEKCLALYGLPPDTPMSYERFLQALHPDDREHIDAALRQAVDNHTSYDESTRAIWPDGSIHWTTSRGQVYYDSKGQPIRMVGVSFDITKWKDIETKIQRTTEKLQRIMASVSDCLWSGEIDEEGNWTYGYYSPVVEKITGRPPSYYMDNPQRWLDTIHSDDQLRQLDAFQRMVSGHSEHEEEEYRIIRPDRTICWVRDSATVTRSESGHLRVDGIVSDISERKQAEEAQQKHNQELQAFFSQTIDGCFFMMLDEPVCWDDTIDQEKVLDYAFAHQYITRINDAMLAQYGATHEQMLKLTPADFFKHNLSHGRDLWRQLFNAGKIRLESDERKLDGTPIWIEGEYILLYDSEGRITGHFGIQRDITESKQLGEELRRAHQNYASLVNSVDGIVWEADAQTFQFNFVSQQAERLLGYPVERWLSEPTFWKDHIHPDDQQWAVDFCIKSTQEKRPHDFEYRMLAADEEVVWLHDVVAVVVENDKPVQLRGVMVDITERKQMEEERSASEARFRAFVDHATDALFFHEWGTILDVNLQACASLGYSREELISMTPHDFDVDLEQAFMDQIEARLNAGEVTTFETRHRRKDGTMFPVEVRVRGFVQGESHFAVSVARDITERKQTEARMRALIDAIPDMLVRHDREGRYLEIKAAPSIPLNYAIPDAIGRTVWEMLPHDAQLAGHILRRIEKALDTNEMDVQEYELAFDGKTIYREARTTPINENEVVMLIRDITERKEAEEALHRYNQRLSILHRIDKGILSAQSPQEIAETVLAFLMQLIPCEWASVVLYNPDITEERVFARRHRAGIQINTGQSQAVVPNEVLERLKAGQSTITADLTKQEGKLAKLAEDLVRQGIHSAMANPIIVHERLIGVVALASTVVDFFTPEYQLIAEEISDQVAIALHQAELMDQITRHNTELEERVRERTIQLEDANRELELFSYSVSHDLRAPLRAIQGFAEIIARRHRASLNDEGRRYFDHIVTAGEQMDQLISDLLDYARLGRQHLHLDDVPLAGIFNTVLDNLGPYIDEIGAQVHLSDNLPIIQGDKILLKQIFTNLLGNALTYHRPGIPPVVNVSCLFEEGYATIQIKDNGIGISPEFHKKIFEIFQRLHSPEQYPGTGIGLAIVKRSVDLLNGKVWLETVAQGSLFCVRLPRTKKEGKST